MASEWLTLRAEQFCVSVRDGTHDSPKAVEDGRFLVTSRHITGGQLDLGHAYLISHEEFDAINRRSKVDQWDVLISMIGTVGELCLIKEDPNFAIKNIGLFKTKGEVEGKWLYYYLKSPDAQQLIHEYARGTTQQYIPLGALRDFPIVLPADYEEMRLITYILGTLDDKIELNRRMNETLEAIARALFKSWFIDFDPVRAKAEGRDTGLPKPLADLFPDSFEDSDLGEIPKGWRLETLTSVASLNPESWAKDTRPEIIEYVDLSSTKWGRIDEIMRYKQEAAPSRAQRVLRPGDTIVGTVRPGNGSYALVSDDGLTGSTGFAVLRPLRPDYGAFVYLAATSTDNIERLSHLADGAAYPAVRAEVVLATQVIKPAEHVTETFSHVVGALLAKLAENERESLTLVVVRDTLLPKLISGELRVKQAERMIENAGC
ncbi:hypothetical protein BH20ACI3_BH20ACI3_22330 [soil metagenome]